MEEDRKVILILRRPFLHIADAIIRVKQKQLNLGVGTKRMIFNIDSAIKHSYLNDDTCFSIDEILEEYFDALLDEGSKIPFHQRNHKDEIFSKFDKFVAMTADENYDSESDTEEPPFEKITINTYYKIKTSLEEPSTDLELKPLPDNLEYVFLEDPLSFLYFQNPIDPVDQEKTIFTCPFGTENVAADHLSRIDNNESSDDSEIDKNFPGETLIEINTKNEPWFADFANYLVGDIIPKGMTYQQKKKFFSDLKCYFWEEPYLSKYILMYRLFDIYGIAFMGPFLKLHKFEYILVAVVYVSKWAEAQALPTNDARVVITFLKKIFCRFGIPKALISDRGTHFCNKNNGKTMKRYGINHRFSTSYQPQTSGQVENTKRALKRILEKTVEENPVVWSRKLDDAMWAFRTAYKTPTGTTPYKLIYGKNCHLPFEIEHRAY
nr:reverse transcriptase domain-containing protein [Tanacetum cinerariifolium]